MEFELIEAEHRLGYYKAAPNRWRLERRRNPDRRIGVEVGERDRAQRQGLRRTADREVIEYLAEAS